jgi:hypothetical protein
MSAAATRTVPRWRRRYGWMPATSSVIGTVLLFVASCVLALALLLPSALLFPPARAQARPSPGTAFVYKPDGTRHCDQGAGVPLAAMAQQLDRGGVRVYTQRKSHDGREGIAVCGKPTGGINVFEIDASDRARALRMGFQPLDPSWLDPRAR